MTRNEKWEDWLNDCWSASQPQLAAWEQQVVDELLGPQPPRLILEKPRSAYRGPSLKDLIEQETERIEKELYNWTSNVDTASTNADVKTYADAMNDYLDNGVPEPESTYDPETQPWWEMPIEEAGR